MYIYICVCVYIIEYYSVIKERKDEISPFVTTWKAVGSIVPSEMSHKVKDKNDMMSLTSCRCDVRYKTESNKRTNS